MKKICQDLSRIFFYVFVFWLPFRIDAIFFEPEVFISGFLSPYLVHSFYLSDVFYLLGLLSLSIYLIFERRKIKIFGKISFSASHMGFFATLFIFSYALSVFFALDNLNSIFYLLRALQFFLFFILILNRFLDFKKILQVFVGVMSLQAIFGILQFILQADLGLHFLGEPLLDVSLKNLAKITLFGADFLRSYGTFAHPNIFGAYLAVAILGLFYLVPDYKSRKSGIFIAVFCLLFLALIFSFSRSAILALTLGMIVYLRKNNFSFVLLSVLSMLLIFIFAPINTVTERFVHSSAVLKMFFSNPFGVGAGNFTLALPHYLDFKLYPWQFQPVHNIFALILCELGIFGIFSFVGLLFVKVKQLLKSRGAFRLFNLSLFVSFLVFGLFDHYLISLYQGQFLFWLIIFLDSH